MGQQEDKKSSHTENRDVTPQDYLLTLSKRCPSDTGVTFIGGREGIRPWQEYLQSKVKNLVRAVHANGEQADVSPPIVKGVSSNREPSLEATLDSHSILADSVLHHITWKPGCRNSIEDYMDGLVCT